MHLRQFLADFYALVGNPNMKSRDCWKNAQVRGNLQGFATSAQSAMEGMTASKTCGRPEQNDRPGRRGRSRSIRQPSNHAIDPQRRSRPQAMYLARQCNQPGLRRVPRQLKPRKATSINGETTLAAGIEQHVKKPSQLAEANHESFCVNAFATSTFAKFVNMP